MRSSAQNGTVMMWTMLIAIVAGVILIFIIISKSEKKKREEQQALLEAKRRAADNLAQENKRRQEQIRAAEKVREEELLHSREMAAVAFSGLIGSDRWDEDLYKEADQVKRIDRLKYDAPSMKVLAYDSRYHTGLVKGHSGSCYLVSGERCNCPDFLRQKRPCKHMYFLGQYVTDHGYDFLEVNYEDGLKDTRAYLVGRFPGGKEAAMANLKERGCIPMEVLNSDVNLAVIGNTTAEKKLLTLAQKEIRMLDYKDALQIFTSEIRHPDIS